MRHDHGWFLLLIFSLLLVSCSGDGQPFEANPSIPGTSPTETRVTTPYASPVVPTPDLDTAVITGRILHAKSGKPLPGQRIYLGEILPMEPEPAYLVTLQVESSPHTTTDLDGWFVFEGILPGTYPVIVWTPFKSEVVLDEEGEKELRLEVREGELIELGEILVDW